MSDRIRVLVWAEDLFAEHQPQAVRTYPQGIGTVVAGFLAEDPRLDVRTGGLDTMAQDLSQESLDTTDVLVWWDHLYQDRLTDAWLARILDRIRGGMGFIALHSAMSGRVFRSLMGATCNVKWREIGEKERLWIIERGHPIMAGLEQEYIDVPHSEMYGECFDIPAPDELLFISWYAGGEVLRSGGTYKRGKGRIFYLTTGHEEYPIYTQKEIQRVIVNAVKWAQPTGGPTAHYTRHSPPLEDIAPQMSD